MQELSASFRTHADILPADLTTEEGLQSVEQAIRNSARLELLVNNAGFGTLKRFWEADLHGQEQMHKLHVMATMRLTHAALGEMVGVGAARSSTYPPSPRSVKRKATLVIAPPKRG